MVSPQIIKLSFADFVLAFIVVNVVKTIVEIAEPENSTAHITTTTDACLVVAGTVAAAAAAAAAA